MKNKIILSVVLIIIFIALLSLSNNAYAATKEFTVGTTYYWGESISLKGTLYYYDDDHTWTKRTLKAGALGDEYYLDELLVKYDSELGLWSINLNPDEPQYGFYIYLGYNNSSPDNKPTGIKYVSGSGSDVFDPMVFELVYDEPTMYYLWLGNRRVTSANADNILGNGKAIYDPQNKTLTLNGASINRGGYDEVGWGINYFGDDDLEIICNGSNSIVVGTDRTNFTAGIFIGSFSKSLLYYTPNITITMNEGASLSAIASDITGNPTYGNASAGIYNVSYGTLTLKGDGSITSNGGKCKNDSNTNFKSYGIYTQGELVINNKKILVANAGENAYYSCGLFAGIDININNSDSIPVLANGGKAQYSYGIETTDLIFEGGFLQATGGAGTAISIGVSVSSARISKGRFIAYSNATKTDTNLIRALNNAPIIEPDVIAYASETKTNGTEKAVYNANDNDKYIYFMAKELEYYFPDVPEGKWYSEGVKYCKDNNMIKGYADGNFGPNDKLTRGQVVTIMYRLDNEPSVAGYDNPFLDVPEGKYYTDAVKWASHYNITTGKTPTSFDPDGFVTRQEMAVFLVRYIKNVMGYNVNSTYDITGIADYQDVSSWAVDAIKYVMQHGVITGDMALGYLRILPCDTATRGQAATILMRFYENVIFP